MLPSRRKNMGQRFDIFKRLPDGRPVLVESCENLADAREHLADLARNAPGEYFIYSEEKAAVEIAIHGDEAG
jgi:hypothetical protein